MVLGLISFSPISINRCQDNTILPAQHEAWGVNNTSATLERKGKKN